MPGDALHAVSLSVLANELVRDHHIPLRTALSKQPQLLVGVLAWGLLRRQ